MKKAIKLQEWENEKADRAVFFRKKFTSTLMFTTSIVLLLTMYFDTFIQIYWETIYEFKPNTDCEELLDICNRFNQYAFWGFILGVSH